MSHSNKLLNLRLLMGTPKFSANWSDVRVAQGTLELEVDIWIEGSLVKDCALDLKFGKLIVDLKEIQLQGVPHFLCCI